MASSAARTTSLATPHPTEPSARPKPKKVLLISSNVPHYRVSVYNYLYRRFLDNGWEFKVASSAIHSQSEQSLQFEFHKLPFQFWRYRQLLSTLRPDVVMFHLRLKDWIFWPLIHWVKLKRIPIICWTKGANLDLPESKVRYHLFNYFHGLSDAIILYSEKQRVHIKPASQHKIFVANNTVNFEDYPEVKATKEEIKREFGIPYQKVVLFVGTMGVDGERKKVQHIIQIFRELDRSDVGLVLAGSGMTDDLKAQLNTRNSMFLGDLHDRGNLRISKLFKAADLFAIPGHVGLALNQAFYWGLPVITEAGIHPPEIQYLSSGSNGFIVGENDLDEFKDRMLYLLDNDAIRHEFSRRAREDIQREASIEGMFSSFREAVESVWLSHHHEGGDLHHRAPRVA